MRIVSVNSLKPGMTTEKPVYSENGAILIQKNISIANSYIKYLIEKNIPSVYIDDEISKGIEVESSIDQEVRVRAVADIKKIFDELSDTSLINKKNHGKLKMIPHEMY